MGITILPLFSAPQTKEGTMSQRVNPWPSTFRAWLVIDDTTAHITARSEQASALCAWFHRETIACIRRRGAGVGGLDVIDFGNPTPAVERRIRSLFAAWQK
jgi:hypothetical protein